MTPPEDAPLSADKPLLAARKRIDRAKMKQAHAQWRERQRQMALERQAQRDADKAARAAAKVANGGPVAPPSADMIVGLAAAGVTNRKIARALHVVPETVSRVLTAQPGSRERIAQLRAELKDLKLTRAHAVEGRMWDRLEKEVADGEAHGVDAIARALLASEKIQAAASGEASASGAPVLTPGSADLAGLVQILINSAST